MTISSEVPDVMYERALHVATKRDLESFLEHLADDYQHNHEVWENRSVPDFLTALADCSRRSGQAGVSAVAPPQLDPAVWQYLACLLLGATVVR